MRVFREVVPSEKKKTQPAVRYQEARVEKKVEPMVQMPPRVLQPRYTPEEYRSLYKKKGRSWKSYYVFAALVLICAGVIYLTFFSEGARQAMTEQEPSPTIGDSSVTAEESISVAAPIQEESTLPVMNTVIPQKIRVLISAPGGGYTHSSVSVLCGQDSWLQEEETVSTFMADQEITLEAGNWPYQSENIRLYSADDEARFTLTSLTNSLGDPPAYRGCIEITPCDGGFRIINEIYLEQYLYAVITSEMPESFGLEAMKAQAVCARSFAVRQCASGKYAEYGADLDDSVSSQTYNDWPETEMAIQAVEETRGIVLMEEGEVVAANYFSTSCGMTADYADAWQTEGPNCLSSLKEYSAPDFGDLSDEENFRQFITSSEVEAPEADTQWFRWRVTMTKNALETQIGSVLPGLGSAYVTQLDAAGDQFESYDGGSIGELQGIYVYQRAASGLIGEILVEGSEKTVKVSGEYNIRRLLAPTDSALTLNDGSTREGISALPSAFWCAEHTVGADGSLASVTFYGGGYGHGVGMSQVGAWKMAESGATYQEILEHYYSGVVIGTMG